MVDTVNLNTGIFTAAGSSGVKVTRNGRFIYVANFNSNNISVVDALQKVWLLRSPSRAEKIDIRGVLHIYAS